MPFKFNPFTGTFDEVQDISGKVDKINPSVDNTLLKHDGTTGDTQETGIVVDDSNNVTGVNDLTVSGNLEVNGTTTTVNTATLDVTDQNITINNGGTDASSEGAGLTVDRVGTDGSFVYEDALASKWKLGALGSEIEVVNVSSSQTLTNKTIDVSANTVSNIANSNISASAGIEFSKMEALTVNRALITDPSGEIIVSTVTNSELAQLIGVTGPIQAGIDSKEDTITGAATTITSTDLTIDRALLSDGSGKVAVSAVTATELGHVSGVTSAIQTQLDSKFEYSVATSSGVFTATAGSTHLVDTSGGTATVTLPAAASNAYVILKDSAGNANTNNITINTPGAETIDGNTNLVVNSDYDSTTLVSDGSNWFIL